MASFNKVLLLGNLTRDPELRVTPKGTSICSFGLAVNRTFKDESGAKRDEVTFVDLDAIGKTAELISKYLSKGSACMIEGRLKFDQWDDKQSGQKRSKLKVVVENVQFLGGAPTGEQHGGDGEQGDEAPRYSAPPPRSNNSRPATPPTDGVDEDVPF